MARKKINWKYYKGTDISDPMFLDEDSNLSITWQWADRNATKSKNVVIFIDGNDSVTIIERQFPNGPTFKTVKDAMKFAEDLKFGYKARKTKRRKNT